MGIYKNLKPIKKMKSLRDLDEPDTEGLFYYIYCYATRCNIFVAMLK
jgi:hypothetical protein